MNFGFAFLLVFVGATIPAGIYGACNVALAASRSPHAPHATAHAAHDRCARLSLRSEVLDAAAAHRRPPPCAAKTHYGTSLANVDWLHGTAESLLSVTNIIIVLALRQFLAGKQQEEGGSSRAADGKQPTAEPRTPDESKR